MKGARGLLPLLAALSAGVPAAAETLVTSISHTRVLITSNYTGASIAVFGAIERDAQTVSRGAAYDIVVTVRGPRQALVVREKEPLGPVWLNQEQQKFPDAPAYLGVFSSRPLAEITSDVLRAAAEDRARRHRQRAGLHQRPRRGRRALPGGAPAPQDPRGALSPGRARGRRS